MSRTEPLSHEALLAIADATYEVRKWICPAWPVRIDGPAEEVAKVRGILDRWRQAMEPYDEYKRKGKA